MNGVHDMGGMHGMGPIDPEKDEPVFHHDWERRAFALTVSTGYLGTWNIDMSRHARELMPPAEYLATSYYEHWLWGLEHLLERFGLIQPGEVDARMRSPAAARQAPPPAPPAGVRVLRASDTADALRRPGARADRRDDDQPARFAPGDPVRARTMNPTGHTRLPRYARGRQGTVERDHGMWIHPDSYAAGLGKNLQRLYSVRFTARELWGPDAPPRDTVLLDLFDDYLDPA